MVFFANSTGTGVAGSRLYLLQQLAGKPLYYIRDGDSFDPGAPNYHRSITIDELVSSTFEPAMSDGIQYRYLVQP